MAYCPKCGNVTGSRDTFCKSCGQRLNNGAQPAQGPRSNNVPHAQCPTCHGAKVIRCERCDGYGKLMGPMFMETCSVCHGTGKMRCPSC